jgi:hypothetical protein
MSDPAATLPLAKPGPESTNPGNPTLVPQQCVVLHEKNGADPTGDSELEQHAANAVAVDGAERKWTAVRWTVVIMAIMSSTFLYALDNTITANIRPSMIEALGNRIDMLPWLSVSYPMGEVGMNPLWCVCPWVRGFSAACRTWALAELGVGES